MTTQAQKDQLLNTLEAALSQARSVTVDVSGAQPAPPAPVPPAPPAPPPPVPPTLPTLAPPPYNSFPIRDATWGQAETFYSKNSGGFGDGIGWVFRLTVPLGTPVSRVAGRFVVSEFQGPATPRQISISRWPNDFRAEDVYGVAGPLQVRHNGTTNSLSYAVGLLGDAARLEPGQTYYLSIRNWTSYNSQPSCGQNTCPAILNHQPAS